MVSFSSLFEKNPKLWSALLTIAISFNAITNDVIMKTFIIDTGFDALTVNGFRIFFSFLIATTIGIQKKGLNIFDGIFSKVNLVRNFVTIVAILCVIHGLSHCAVSRVDIVNYLIPFFMAIISYVIFRAKFKIFNFLLMLVCVIFYLYNSTWYYSFPLILASFLFAFAELWIKHKMANENFLKACVSIGVTGSILFSCFYLPKLFILSKKQLILALLMGIGDLSIVSIITLRCRLKTTADFLPLRYSSILFSVLADKIFFKAAEASFPTIIVILTASVFSLIFPN